MSSSINQLQIETTSRCTLKCPQCSRTIFANKLGRPIPNRDIDPDLVYRFLDCDLGKQIDQLLLCGDTGDAIYYPRLFEFIDKFRQEKTFRIVTNGSYQKDSFWHDLCNRLTSEDSIEFSIDGWDQESNQKYRVNCDWSSIMSALDIVKTYPVKIYWATNIFSFNYNNLDKIKALADSFNAEFLCKKTTSRFGDKSLRPPENFVDVQSEFNQSIMKETIKIDPGCVKRVRNTISVQHYFLPCGWISTPFVLQQSRIWPDREKWSIKNQTLDQLQNTTLKDWIDRLNNHPETADVICKMRCRPNQSWKIFHDL